MNFTKKISSGDIEAVSVTLKGSQNEICRDLSEIIIIRSGSGEISVDGTSACVCSGDAFLAPPLTYRKISTSDTLEYISVFFNMDSVCPEGDPLRAQLEFEGQGKLFRDGLRSELLLSAVSGLGTAEELSREYRHEYAAISVRQAVIILCSLSGECISFSGEELGARVCAYISENLTEDLSLEKIAKSFFISKFYLCRAFKSYVGSSLHNFIVAKRVALAKRLIDSGEVASSVAYKVGFGDYSTFYRAYVKHIGKAPTEG